MPLFGRWLLFESASFWGSAAFFALPAGVWYIPRMRLKWYWLVFLAAALAACNGAATPVATPAPSPTPTATAAPVVAALPPALAPAEAALRACARQVGVPLAVWLTPQAQDAPPAANLRLWWGEPPAGAWQAYRLGTEQLIPIVQQENAARLTETDLRRVVMGQMLTWPSEGDRAVPLALWLPLPGSAASARLDAWLGVNLRRSDAALAPSPQAMLAAVAGDQAALGFVPRGWLRAAGVENAAEVKALPLEQPPQAWQAPVLALLPPDAPPSVVALVGCLQQGKGHEMLQPLYGVP